MNSLKEYWSSITEDRKPRNAYILHGIVVALAAHLGARPGAVPAHASQLINIVAILASLLVATLVLLIELRGRVRLGEDPRAQHDSRDTRNLDYAYYATHLAILLGLGITAALLLQEQLPGVTNWGTRLVNAAIYAACGEFALAVAHCLKRLRRTYEVFGKGNR